MLAAIEGGGTRFRAAVGDSCQAILAEIEVPTSTPAETLRTLAEFLGRHPVEALGIATFGPLDIEGGRLLGTPKPGWSGADLRGSLLVGREALPFRCETDVIGAALGELAFGAGRGAQDLVYVTVGTGIGAGILVGGRPLHGRLHPEVGHLRLARAAGDFFPGICPFHGPCWEGLASGPAIAARAGQRAEDLEDGHPCWDFVAHDLAQGLLSLVLTCAPERLILGGGVGRRPGLLERVLPHFSRLAGDYLPKERFPDPAQWILRPGLGRAAGLAGAFLLAEEARRAGSLL